MQLHNERLARVDSLVVYLKLSAEELWHRIVADPKRAATRPNLSSGGIEEVVEMLAWGAPTYETCANVTLDGQLISWETGRQNCRSGQWVGRKLN